MTARLIEADVHDALRRFAGARAYFDPLAGNHGDRLILLGAELVMAPMGFQRVDDPADAEVIVVNGGGGMFAQPWCGDLGKFKRYTLGHPATPVVVLPSSFYWGDLDFAACFAGRTAESVLIARERLSLARLQEAGLPDSVRLILDRDLAFHLNGTPLVEDARRVPSGGYVLLVERFDEEQSTGKPLKIKRIRRVAKYLPQPVQSAIKRSLDRIRRHHSGFERTVLQQAIDIDPGLAGRRVVYHDVSNVTRNTFEEFIEMIAAADAIVTTRMHAGILAAMLGKPTFMKGKAGDYRKLQGVYEYSMTEMAHVHMLDS